MPSHFTTDMFRPNEGYKLNKFRIHDYYEWEGGEELRSSSTKKDPYIT